MTRMMAALMAVTLLSAPALAQDQADPAQDDQAELAKQLENPISSLMFVPIQANYDENFGPEGDGSVWVTNIQPVLPFSLNEDWNGI